MNLEVTNGLDYTIQTSTEVTIKDFFVLVRGAEITTKLDATFDFKDVPPNVQGLVAQTLIGMRLRLTMPTDEGFERMNRQSQRYRERKAAFEALPWHKRLFAKKPWDYRDED